MAYNFEGRKILVSGAGNGIGRAIACSLAAAGAKVYALDCVKDALDDLAKEIPAITTLHQDLRNWETTREAVSLIDDLDGLVNSAAIGAQEPAVDVSKDKIDLIFDVNLKAAINLMQVIGKKIMSHGRGGSIVNISSVGGSAATTHFLPYCVSKAGLNMASKVFALELGPHKIRVNSVSPTMVNTDAMNKAVSSEFLSNYVKNIPMGRMDEIDDVVQSVLFLLSDSSKMVSGTTLMVDGGHTCYLPV